jgi:hypothetical protein
MASRSRAEDVLSSVAWVAWVASERGVSDTASSVAQPLRL